MNKAIWDFWTFRGSTPCINCWAEAVTLHEIIPRSRYPGWKEDFLNSVPVCAECHDILQEDTIYCQSRIKNAAINRSQAIKHWKGIDNEQNLHNFGPALQAQGDDYLGKPTSEDFGGDGPEDDAGLERDGKAERSSLPLRRSILGDC